MVRVREIVAQALWSQNSLLAVPESGGPGKERSLSYRRNLLRSLGDSATRLWLASAILLATNLIWILAVALNLLGPLGPLSAGILGWIALIADLPGVALLAAAYAGLTRAQERASSRLRSAIVRGFGGALIPVLGGGFPVPTFVGGSIGKLLVAPNILLSGYVSSLQLGRAASATKRTSGRG